MQLTTHVNKEVIDHFISWLPDFGASLLLLLLFVMLASLSKMIIFKFAHRFDPQRGQVIELLGTTSKYVINIVGFITALGSMGVNITALVASLGLSGFALSFALKDALSNLLAGILILIYQPFKIGDYIIVAGQEGKVDHLSLRYVQLKTDDHTLLIPNASMLTNSISILKATH